MSSDSVSYFETRDCRTADDLSSDYTRQSFFFVYLFNDCELGGWIIYPRTTMQ